MAITDKFKKGESLFATTLSSGISTGTGETITLASVSGLPTDTEMTLTFNRIDGDGVVNTSTEMERITGTIVGSALTSFTRGTDGSTEQAHSAGTVIEYIFNSQDYNDMVDGILAEHNQDGTHDMDEIVDSNSNEVVKFAEVASAVNEITVTNAATGDASLISATGGDSNIDLNLIPKGTGEVKKRSSVVIQVEDGATALTTGNGKAYITIPEQLNGMNLSAVHARAIVAPTGATIVIQIRNLTEAADMLSTRITIDATELGSDTAATPAVIDTDEDDVATNDCIRIDVDQVGSTVAGSGLIVRLEFDLA